MARVALLLDLDGTVWDCSDFYSSTAGLAAPPLSGGWNAAKLLRGAGVTPARFREACMSAHPPIAVFPGLTKILGALVEQGVVLGVVTNLPDWIASPMLAASGVSDCVEVVVTYGTTRRHKPHPDPIVAAMSGLGLTCHPRHWYVGDSPGDCQAAKVAGLSFAFAGWGSPEDAPPGTDLELKWPHELVRLAGEAS